MTLFDKDDHGKKKGVLDILDRSDVKLTAQSLLNQIKYQYGMSFRDAKKILTCLVNEQELSYNYLYGTTYIEKSFLKPVQVTKHFCLKPGRSNSYLKENYSRESSGKLLLEIIVEPGIAFGSGQHPTTCLCLEAIDLCFFENNMISVNTQNMGADIGTGSGVLAMAMCLSGLASCRAYEIDPVSVNEARKNVAANNLGQKIAVIDDSIDPSPDKYAIICANLRTPTLKNLSGLISSSLKPGGVVIMSGMRDWEKQDLVDLCKKKGLAPIWEKDKKHWAGVMFVKDK